ncbi:MAG: undecaprenyl-phosphate glucose phosphotransferase [Hyphomicrobiales bacterium]|nr:MAG: undecaprenyl-phosphate glucose phosphotransferase [Hyphomicrobiales bacterium]
MFRLDPKQAILEHVARKTGAGAVQLGPEAQAIVAAPLERNYSSTVVTGIAQAIEALLLASLGFAIYASYVAPGQEAIYLPTIVLTTLFANVLFNAGRTHRVAMYRTGLQQTGRVLAAWSLVFLAFLAVAFLLKGSDLVSRFWLVNWYVFGALLLVFFRLSLRQLVLQWTAQGKLRRRTVIVGGGHDAEQLVDSIRKSALADVRILGVFDDRNDERSPESVASVPKLGRVADLIEFARQTRVDLVIVSMPLSAEKRVLEMLSQLWVLPVDIRLSAHMNKLRFTSKAYSYVGDVPVFDMADRPISDWNLVFKWLFDMIVATIGLIVFSPVMLVTAIAIKLDSKGPVFFKQKRHGFNNEVIEVYKFRSMRTDMADPTVKQQVTRGDPRVTRVGRFIRKTSIDELPQFFNVLRGELSVVGPRPHVVSGNTNNVPYQEAVEGYFARHKVKPGITGWAQINGWRGETDTVDKILNRVQHDLYYIEHWSILLDLYIVVMTPISLLTKSENAY